MNLGGRNFFALFSLTRSATLETVVLVHLVVPVHLEVPEMLLSGTISRPTQSYTYSVN
jgi:hypothetical protein